MGNSCNIAKVLPCESKSKLAVLSPSLDKNQSVKKDAQGHPVPIQFSLYLIDNSFIIYEVFLREMKD